MINVGNLKKIVKYEQEKNTYNSTTQITIMISVVTSLISFMTLSLY